MIAALYVVNQNNAEFAKKLVALINEFTAKYEALVQTVMQDRRESSDRWLERDRQLIDAMNRNTEALVKNSTETHHLRNLVQPLVLSVESDRRRKTSGSQSTRGSGGGDGNAAD